MTIANTKASNVFNANGVTRDFNLGFVYDENVSGISIKVIDTEGTETEVSSNYTIYNGVLTYPTVDSGLDPLASGYKLTVERLTPQTQSIDLIQQGPLDAETLEGGYDKLTLEVQELQDNMDRAIKFPVQTEGETDAQQYIDDLTDLKNTATSAASVATQQAGLATTAKNAAEAAQDKAEKWAEGTDAQVTSLGGTHSAQGWANIAQTAAESENVQTVVTNIDDINTVADNITDVRTVSSISNSVNTVATHDDDVLLVSDNMSSVLTTASNITSVNTVAAAASKVVTVGDNISDVGTVADNASAVSTVATDIAKVNTVATDIETIKAVNENKTNIDAVAGNAGNITAVAANSADITTVANDKTNIDTVAGNTTNINTVATNTADINTVAADITKISSVADDLTNIDAVADNETNIDTVATNISDVTSVATSIADVGAVAADLTNIDAVADDLTNINTVATNISDVNATGQAIEDVSAVADNLADITLVANDLENIDEVATNVAEWQKPSDWIDIRSAAIDNSIYFLVGHSADYATYPEFNFTATISDSGTYDVYIDGVKYTTANSEAATSLMWQTLALTSGFDVTYPAALRTHIIRVTPSLGTDTITKIYTTLDKNKGVMWAHFNIDNPINIYELFNTVGNNDGSKNTPILEAVTAKNDEIKAPVGFGGAFHHANALVEVPKFTSTTNGSFNCYRAFRNCTALGKVKLKDIIFTNSHSMFMDCAGLKEVSTENMTMRIDTYTFWGTTNLKKLPDNILFADNAHNAITNNKSLTSTFIDTSKTTDMTKLGIYSGTLENAMTGIKGITVSNSAPFTGTSPQIDIRYTGLNRNALVALFNSMPYNVGYTVVGSPTITDGVASGFSSSDYLNIPTLRNATFSSLEFQTRILNFSGSDANNVILRTGSAYFVIRYSSGKIEYIYQSDDGSKTLTTNNDVSSIQDLYIKTIMKNNLQELYTSTDGTNWQLENSATDTITSLSNLFYSGTALGAHPSYDNQKLRGSMDLNNTHLNIDGVPWFTGKAAMTKTCSIVGCTGTADLTDDDKAIATDKGWALTLS